MGADGARYPPHRAKGHGGDERPPLDVIVMRSWGDWINGGPEPKTSGLQNFPLTGALDTLFQSTLSDKAEPVNLVFPTLATRWIPPIDRFTMAS